MPSTVTHLRVASSLLPDVPPELRDDFVTGNVAPDCGVLIPGTHTYEPPRHITHFTDLPQRWDTHTHPERFRTEYLDRMTGARDRAFCLGCWCHLVVDNAYIDDLWGVFLRAGTLDKALREQMKRVEFPYLDALWLTEHPEDEAVSRFLAAPETVFPVDRYPASVLLPRLTAHRAAIRDAALPPKPETLAVTPEMVAGFTADCAEKLRGALRF